MKTYSNLTREERINKIMDGRRTDLCLVLENLYEDSNIAAILRSSEAFGVGQVYVIHPEGKKPRVARGAASGSTKWLNVEYFTSTKTCLKKLKKDGFKIYGALVNPQSDILWKEDFSGKVAIMMGTEVSGLTEEAQKLVDKNLYLPMFGLTESLNVSVAAGMFLYEVIRQKEA